MTINHSKSVLRCFICDLEKNGIYVLPCGGGVITEPRQAIYLLKDKYGEDGLRRLCIEIVRCTVSGEDLILGEGIQGLVTGILYHLADENALRELICVYQQQFETKEHSVCKLNADLFNSIGFLISCICRRLGKPLPDGIWAATHEDEVSCFWSDKPPAPLHILLLALIVMLPRYFLQTVWEWIYSSIRYLATKKPRNTNSASRKVAL